MCLGWVGCNTSSDHTQVSSGLFLAPIKEPTSSAITVHADRIDFLRAIRPGELESTLRDVPTEPFVLGPLSQHNPDDSVTPTDDLLIYEAQSTTVLSVNICPDPSQAECGQVKLHYNSKGLDEEGAESGSLATNVVPIKLQNGWILAFDATSKNILAFRAEAPRGGISYRSGDVPTSANFGLGNGVLLSVVIRGIDMAQRLNTVSEPIVTQFFELERNKVLLFFSNLRAVHLLEVSEVDESKDFDLTSRVDQTNFNVKMLQGQIALFPTATNLEGSFLPFGVISQKVTQNDNLKLATFQPLLVPDPGRGLALVFDQTTSNFFQIFALKDPSGAITRGDVATAIRTDVLFNVLQGGGVNTVSPPLTMSGGFRNPDPKATELVWFEKETKNLLAYNYKTDLSKNLRIFVGAANILIRRDPTGRVRETVGAQPGLTFATDDVVDNRLAFETELDEVVSINYSTGVVVVVANKQAIGDATGQPLANFTFLEPLDDNNLRAFDAQSNSLIEIRIEYAAFPVEVR